MNSAWTDDEVYLVALRGHNLFLQGRYAEASEIFEGLRSIDAGNLYCVNALAALYIQQGQVQKGIDILSEALAIHPQHLESRARRCEAYLMSGRVAEAHQDGEVLRRSSAGIPQTRLEVLLSGRKKVGPSKQLSEATFDN